MKRYIFLVWVLLLIWLTACVPQAEDSAPIETSNLSHNDQASLPSVELEPTVGPSATPIMTSTTSPTSLFTLNQDMPDVMIDTTQKENSYYTLFEDEEYIYLLLQRRSLICISTKNGQIEKISDDCECFYVNNGIVYYDAKIDSNGEKDYIEAYEPSSGERKLIKETEGDITQIACYNDYIYYVLRSKSIGRDLYLIDLNGEYIFNAYESVFSFCIYDEKLFYITDMGEGGYLYEYKAGQIKEGEQLVNRFIDGYFDISFNKIVFTDVDNSTCVFDISTGNIKELPFKSYNFALIGQYVLYYVSDENDNLLLKAYDFLTDKEYTMLQIANFLYENVSVHSTEENIYLYINNGNILEIYRVNIDAGQTSVTHVVSVEHNEELNL